MKGRKLNALALGLAIAAVAGSPAQARLDQGGAARAPVTQVRVEGFDWSDAAVGVGIGATAGLVAGTALMVRRHRLAPDNFAGPAAR
jgi:hypothetical protein